MRPGVKIMLVKLPYRFVLFILFLFSTLMVSSCGVPKSSTTLKVTNSMALGNSAYQGGLVFYGRSAGGKFFSVPVAYSAASAANTAEVILDKGTWTFSAVGWSSDPDTFEGDSECAVTTVNLDENDKTVVLDLDKANCTNAEFGGNFLSTQFKPHGLITCGTLYTNSSTLDTLSTDSPDFCSSLTSISPDLKRWAKSARIMIPAIAPGLGPQPNSPLSFCRNLTYGKTISTKRLPAKGVPFIVELYETTCADVEKKLMQRYELREGLTFTYPNFDHKVFTTPTSSNLYLLTTISRRGISSLMASLPSFSCESTPCSAIPETSSSNRVIAPGQSFYLEPASPLVSCGNFSSVTVSAGPTSLVVNTGMGCEEKNGKIFIRLDSSHLTTLNCTNTCTAYFLFDDGGATSMNIGLSLQVEGPGVPSLAAYNLLFGTVGHENITSTAYPTVTTVLDAMDSLRTFTDGDQDRGTRHYGILSQIRDLFNPEGVGGIFSQYQTSSSLIGVGTNISLWEDGIQKSFNIIVESDTGTPEAYLKQNTNPYGTTVDHSSFTHKMTISRIIGGAFYPEKKLRWVYGKKVGTAEFKNVSVYDGKHTTERSLVYWNTEFADHARFETYIYEREVDAATPSQVLRLKSNFIRAEREATSGEGNARIEHYGYESKKETSNTYSQRAQKSGIVLKDTRSIYFHSSVEAVKDVASGDPDFFARAELKPFTFSKSLTPKTSSALSPNGNHFVSSWSEHNGSNWVVKILRRSGSGRTLESYTLAISSDQPHPKVSINNSGHATVAFVAGVTSSYSLFALSWDGTAWRYYDATASTTSSATVSSGVISTFSALASASSFIAFDLIDEDPSSSSTSKKRLIYSIKPNSTWELNHTSFNSGSWSAPDAFSASQVSAQPTHLSLVKVGSSFHVAWIYNASGYYLRSLTTDFVNSPTNVATASILPVGITPNALFSRENSATLSDLYIASDTGPITKSQYNTSTPGLTTPENISGVKYNELQTPYCFARSRAIASRPTLAAAPETSLCNLPHSSYAPPIRNTLMVDHDNDGSTPNMDHGFKQDIQSLNPATFKSLFTLP